jgi:16S rRNA G966 N2-methylase RsmD
MQYKYAKEQINYSDFASGKVFHSLPRYPAFPIRLANEIFQRCVEYRKTVYEILSPCVLYDPCCGAAYHLSMLGYLHGEFIREIIASDVDEKAVALAKRNLALVDVAGLDKRMDELSKMLDQYGKTSHEDALKSAHRLREKLPGKRTLETSVFQASAADAKTILRNIKPKSVDIVFTDVPYGQHSNWQDSDVSNPLWSMLDSLLGVVSSSSIVAIVSDKQQKALHEGYQRIEQFQVGKRRIAILKPV